MPFSPNLSSHFVCRSAESPEDRIALLLPYLAHLFVANNAATLTPSLYRWFQLQVAWTLWKRSTILKPDISVHRDFIPARKRLTTHVDNWSSSSAPHPQKHKTLSLDSPEISLLCCARAYEGFRPPSAPHVKAALKVRWLYHTTRTRRRLPSYILGQHHHKMHVLPDTIPAPVTVLSSQCRAS